MKTSSHTQLGVIGISAIWLFVTALTGCSSGKQTPTLAPVAAKDALFREAAVESGINFFMHFLPNEQGETYKVNLYDHGAGIAAGDYDGDGNDDVYILNQNGPNALYRNKGDGTFADVTAEAGVGLGDRVCVSAVFADYDNDGREDLFVTSVRGGNVLFHNEGNGKFRDVTIQAGLAFKGHSQAALFFDYNRDGYLDLLVTSTGKWTTDEYNSDGHYYTGLTSLEDIVSSQGEDNRFYQNDGHGHFTLVTEQAGLKGLGWAADAVAFDYDEDGWQDLFVTNMFGQSQLYHNTGKGQFIDFTSRTLSKTSWGGMGAKTFDYNNDGKLDLFVTDMHSDMWMSRDFPAAAVEEHKKYLTKKGRSAGPGADETTVSSGGSSPNSKSEHGGDSVGLVYGNTFFRNEGKGHFTEISDQAGLETFWPWGALAGDFDNDGWVDLFVPSGMGHPFFYWHNSLLMNKGDGTFADKSRAAGIDPPPDGINQEQAIGGKPASRSSRSAVVADFDGDGRLDMVVNNFNGRAYYFRNQAPQHNYVRFSLHGTKSNRDALGAVVHLFAGGKTFVREVEGSSGYLSCPSKIVHFGLGDIKAIDRVEVLWPSGIRQSVQAKSINTLHQITEPADELKK